MITCFSRQRNIHQQFPNSDYHRRPLDIENWEAHLLGPRIHNGAYVEVVSGSCLEVAPKVARDGIVIPKLA